MNKFIEQLELLTGHKRNFPPSASLPSREQELFGGGGIDYSQFNEFLLALGYDRVTKAFFNHFLCPKGKRKEINNLDKETPYRIETFQMFEESVRKFRKFALLKYGNFKFAYKTITRMKSRQIEDEIEGYQPISEESFKNRPVPLIDSIDIKREQTYLLGYIAGEDVKKLKEKKEQGEPVTYEEDQKIEERRKIVSEGIRNYKKYLTDDYMDVYVATSMRNKEDFHAVYDLVKGVFSHPVIKDLRLRYFDPTQADPQDRLDKGLLEGLMVKRAKCTIYCAQESDTFGKDSELAATLAQGKPVIAYVPKINFLKEHEEKLFAMLEESSEGKPRDYLRRILFDRHPRCISENQKIVSEEASIEEMVKELAWRDQRLYNLRADTLHQIHPLSLQINLQTGVANGVIVVRSVDECAQVLKGILLRNLEFDIEAVEVEGREEKSFVLKERSTGSIFRVVTGDALLTNSFWNFYAPLTQK